MLIIVLIGRLGLYVLGRPYRMSGDEALVKSWLKVSSVITLSFRIIVITRADKGRGTLAINKYDYMEKVQHILNDASKFKTIKDSAFSYITKLEGKLSRLLRQLLKVINEDTFNQVFTSDSSLSQNTYLIFLSDILLL